MGNLKSGCVVAYGSGRLHESFSLQSFSHSSNGVSQRPFVNCSRNQSQSLSRVVARRASTVYLLRFMKTRLANILLFPPTSPVLACLLCCLLMSFFFVILCLGICVEVPNALFGYNSVRCPYKTVSVLSGLILGNICKPSVRTKETVCYLLVSVLSIQLCTTGVPSLPEMMYKKVIKI